MSARPSALMKGFNSSAAHLYRLVLTGRVLLFIGKVIVSHCGLDALSANEAHHWHIANRKQSDLVQVF